MVCSSLRLCSTAFILTVWYISHEFVPASMVLFLSFVTEWGFFPITNSHSSQFHYIYLFFLAFFTSIPISSLSVASKISRLFCDEKQTTRLSTLLDCRVNLNYLVRDFKGSFILPTFTSDSPET